MSTMKYGLASSTLLLLTTGILLSRMGQPVYAATALFPEHAHVPIEVPVGAKQPRLSLRLSRDVVDGFNLQLLTEHFVLNSPPPDLAQEELIALALDENSGLTMGHGHLYINGQKRQRLYGRSVHLPSTLFLGGVNQVTVTLNNHGHRYWSMGGRQILATLFVKPKEAVVVIHRFDSFPASLPIEE